MRRSTSLIRLAAVGALVAQATSASADESAVRAAIEAIFPPAQVQSIAPAPVPGLFEVAVDGRVVYVTGDGRFILGGPLVDTQTRINLTAARLEKMNAIPWDSLPLDLAIKRVKGAGTRRIAIFEDPDCPYCKALEKTLNDVDDVTIYVMLYPIASLHPQATDKSKTIWCAKDPAKAWDDVMRTGAAPADSPACETPIAKLAAFAQRHRITGTPTMILSDGQRIVGSVQRDVLERHLLRAAQTKK